MTQEFSAEPFDYERILGLTKDFLTASKDMVPFLHDTGDFSLKLFADSVAKRTDLKSAARFCLEIANTLPARSAIRKAMENNFRRYAYLAGEPVDPGLFTARDLQRMEEILFGRILAETPGSEEEKRLIEKEIELSFLPALETSGDEPGNIFNALLRSEKGKDRESVRKLAVTVIAIRARRYLEEIPKKDFNSFLVEEEFPEVFVCLSNLILSHTRKNENGRKNLVRITHDILMHPGCPRNEHMGFLFGFFCRELRQQQDSLSLALLEKPARLFVAVRPADKNKNRSQETPVASLRR